MSNMTQLLSFVPAVKGGEDGMSGLDVSSAVAYDPTTDSMYVKIRPGEGVDCRVFDERDLVIDLDGAGNEVGYDIQYASRNGNVVMEALAKLHQAVLAKAWGH